MALNQDSVMIIQTPILRSQDDNSENKTLGAGLLYYTGPDRMDYGLLQQQDVLFHYQ